MSQVSVVIATFERPGACERALRSALAQLPPPLEVLICDDGSSADTLCRLQELERLDRRVRVVAAPAHFGTPGPARNRGLQTAAGDWIAFLDDDDEWLPGMLSRQLRCVRAGNVDLVGANARLSDGSLYFPNASASWRPTRADVLRANPLITSTVLARRSSLLQSGGFSPHRWARGVEDYAAWLALADRGARFCVLGDVLARYESCGKDRLSGLRRQQEMRVARLFWHRWRRAPLTEGGFTAAVHKTLVAIKVAGEAGGGTRSAPATFPNSDARVAPLPQQADPSGDR